MGKMRLSRRVTRQEALDYHSSAPPGKIEVRVTKGFSSQRDLSLAYTPGVAEPVRAIAEEPLDAYRYTAKGNLVAVVTNGTAVLGLGNVGALAGKPVMEGKGVLFKAFADIDVFDLELETTEVDEFVRIVKALEPTFGGINLEDIAAPECFEIERRLREEMEIPVFHDDQHGTAIIAGAALLSATEVTGRTLTGVRTVINGAGASALACARFLVTLGVPRSNITLVDSKGVVYRGRGVGMNPYKEEFASDTQARTLEDALQGADFFLGLSVAGALKPDMLAAMAPNPIVFALANPDPEIDYDTAKEVRPDAVVATGRSDYPNQVNNVLGFPFIFRGALDVKARAINDEMKVAAARALAALAKEDVPDAVLRAYGMESLQFGPDYLIPKPLDDRMLTYVAPAVAEAAMRTGVARERLDLDEYRERLIARSGKARALKLRILQKARTNPKRVVFTEGEESKIIRAAAIVQDEGIAHPILIGRDDVVKEKVKRLGLHVSLDVVHPSTFGRIEEYAEHLYTLRQRKGVTRNRARQMVRQPNTFGALMVSLGDADAFVAGLTYHYPDVIRPALQVVGTRSGSSLVAGLYIIIARNEVYFFTDPTVNIDPSAEELAEIAILAAERVEALGMEPKVAMLSFSNFGSTRHAFSEKVRRATEIVKARRPDLAVDGEMQADTAVVPELMERDYPFSHIQGGANVLVFPDLEAANVAYKLLQRLGGAQAIGPVLMGMGKPMHVLQRGDEVDDIVNITAMAVVDAQEVETP